MVGEAPMSFDPETVALLKETLEDAWAALRPEQQATMQKTALAELILDPPPMANEIANACVTLR